MVFTLSKAQVSKLVKTTVLPISYLAGKKQVLIVLPEDITNDVSVIDDTGLILGSITVKEAWAL